MSVFTLIDLWSIINLDFGAVMFVMVCVFSTIIVYLYRFVLYF